jgi:hypothetical protein
MSQLFNFSFQTLAGANDSPGAINKNQVVYAYTQNAKTLLVLTNGDSRIAGNALADVKSTFGLTSIGTPTRANGQIISLGEVLVNNDYVTQVFDDTTSRRVEMNQPASAPVVFTTATTLTGVVANSFAGEKGYKEWIGTITFPAATGSAVTVSTYYNSIGVAPTVTFSTGTINGIGASGSGFYIMDFVGTLTTGNLSTSWVVLNNVPALSGFNVINSAKVNFGTSEVSDKIILSFWSGSTTNVNGSAGTPSTIGPFTVPFSIKFFG